MLTQSGKEWARIPLPGVSEIDGINAFLNGSDRFADFHVAGDPLLVHDDGDAVHVVDARIRIPVPTSLPLLAGAVIAFGLVRRRAA